MAEIKWIKIVTDIFDDEKMLLIEAMPDKYAIITCWFKLLCLAGKQNNCGVFMLNDRIPYTDEMLATIFRMPLNSVRLALDTFAMYGMIEIINGVITIPKWDKHQSLEAYEKKKLYDKEYQAKRRAEHKLLLGQSSDSRTTSNDSRITEEEREEEKEKKKKRESSASHFTPPTLDEVKAYVREKGLSVDPVQFYEYFTEGNWKDAKGNPVRNWKQKILTWEKFQPVKAKPKVVSFADLTWDDEEVIYDP